MRYCSCFDAYVNFVGNQAKRMEAWHTHTARICVIALIEMHAREHARRHSSGSQERGGKAGALRRRACEKSFVLQKRRMDSLRARCS